MHVSKHLERPITVYGTVRLICVLLYFTWGERCKRKVTHFSFYIFIYIYKYIYIYIYVCVCVCNYNRVPSGHRVKLIVHPYSSQFVYQKGLLSSCVFSSLEQQVVRVGHRKGSGFQPRREHFGGRGEMG